MFLCSLLLVVYITQEKMTEKPGSCVEANNGTKRRSKITSTTSVGVSRSDLMEGTELQTSGDTVDDVDG